MTELAMVLRAWRTRLRPADVGMPVGAGQRIDGLRRQELAVLAGLSVDYVDRLEQGRATNPSADVLEALARALRLSAAEHEHLFRAAGRVAGKPGLVPRHVLSGVVRMADRWTDLPAGVFTAAEQGRFEAALASDLRVAAARYPADPELAALVADLLDHSPRFATSWAAGTVTEHASDTKLPAHPAVGELRLDCDVLTVPVADLHVVVYSGTPDADRLRRAVSAGAVN